MKGSRICFNCLRHGHSSSKCPSTGKCFVCQRKHHTLLHRNAPTDHQDHAATMSAVTTVEIPANLQQNSDPASAAVSSYTAQRVYNHGPSVILSTAIVTVRSPSGKSLQVHALLDPGSEVSFVTGAVVQFLQLARREVPVPVTGVGSRHSCVAKHLVQLCVESCTVPRTSLEIDALVLSNITSYVPPLHVVNNTWPYLKGLTLADSNNHPSERIELLLGADVYASILLQDLRRGVPGSPIAQKTILGWILLESVAATSSKFIKKAVTTATSLHTCSIDLDINDTLKAFWQLEEVPPPSNPLSNDELVCEQFYQNTYTRDGTGRYIVWLPWKPDGPCILGDSKTTATVVLQRSQRQLASKPDVAVAYSQFLTEYAELGHMERIPSDTSSKGPIYYLPHHAVVKSTSSTTKLRVVFNASQPSTNGRSLKDCLLVGPKLQQDLMSVIMR